MASEQISSSKTFVIAGGLQVMNRDGCLGILAKISPSFTVDAVTMAAINVVMLEILKSTVPTASFSALRVYIHPVLVAVIWLCWNPRPLIQGACWIQRIDSAQRVRIGL